MSIKVATMETSGMIEAPDFNRYWSVLRRRWWLMLSIIGLSTGAALALALQQPKLYEAEEKILVRSDRSPSLTGLDQSGLDALGNLKALGRLSDPIATVVESIRSPELLNLAFETLRATSDIQDLDREGFIDSLDIRPIPGTDIISIKYSHASPELAAAAASLVTDLYINADIQANQQQTARARQFIQQSLPAVENELRRSEQELRQFQERNRAASLDDESTELVKLLARLEERLVDNQAQLTLAAQQAEGLKNKLGTPTNQALDAVKLSQTSGVQSLLVKLENLENELDETRTIYQDTHPKVQAIVREIAAVNQRLGQRVTEVVGPQQLSNLSRANLQMGELQQTLTADLVRRELERDSLMDQQQQLVTLLSRYRQRLDDLPRLEQRQQELTRRLTASQDTYETLLKRLQEIQLAENQAVGNITKIAAATLPLEPVASSKKLILAAGLLLGSLMGVSLAFLVDWLDRSIKSPQEAQKLMGYPILGSIPSPELLVPYIAPSSRVLSQAKSILPLENAYRDLQANLHYALREDIRTILVTSLKPGEGKAETAVNLAATVAASGQSVLLVELDLESPTLDPQQQQLWVRSNRTGLIQVLNGQGGLSESLQRPAPNLSVLTLGAEIGQRPILALDQLAIFLKEAKQRYQFVILSAPSLSQSVEALALSRVADGMLLVVHPKVSTSDDLLHYSAVLHQERANVLGLVLSGFSDSHRALPGIPSVASDVRELVTR